MKTEILKHDIYWTIEKPSIKEMDEASIEHIEKLIKDGYSSGEIHVSYGKNGDKTASGWWEIVNWSDIACELYNNVNAKAGASAIKARKRFDKYWN